MARGAGARDLDVAIARWAREVQGSAPRGNRLGRPSGPTLSKRELEVLRQVAEDASNREVARRLFVSAASIKTHLVHIYDRLGVRDRAAAVGEAYRRGLLT